MNDNPYYHQDEPTEPTNRRPPTPQQGKLIIGSFKDAPKPADRKPYQNPHGQNQPPAQQGQSGQPGPSWQQGRYQQGQPAPQNQRFQPAQPQPQPGTYSPQQQLLQNQQIPPVAPASAPGGPQYPYHQSSQTPVGPTPTKKTRRPRRRGCTIGCLSVLIILVVLLIIGGVLGQRVLAFGSTISTQSPLSTQTGYMNTSNRVNILVLGYGGAGHNGAYLTDSMMVMSLLPPSHHTTLISVPRDLWVQIPEGSGNYGKINSVYEDAAKYNNTDPVAGGNAAAQKVSLITGLDIQYWVTINFTGFKEFIDSIGGVDVYVPDSFSAHYPANDNPSINPNWITVTFTKGMTHMNGATAMEYARARYVFNNPAESTDFARSVRQQIIIKAALSKVKSISTWPSMYSALSALEKTVYTNLSLADLAQFALKMDLNNAHHVGLSNQNVLVDSTSSDGQYILLPQNNNWQLIKDYVKQQLYN
ncbi:MAG TPA: LCP family protein [Ktedonobacteraceae bacterium]|nr:LCP family protein [Ktedonobacteraceae bacterium]